MRKFLFITISLFSIIMVTLALLLVNTRSSNLKLKQINVEYEYYLNRSIYGTELATLINKAIDNNKKQEIEKDKNGFYIGNDTDSILISIKMIDFEDKIQMEKIFTTGTEQFIDLFNSCLFISENVTYHEKTGRIATIEFKQITE